MRRLVLFPLSVFALVFAAGFPSAAATHNTAPIARASTVLLRVTPEDPYVFEAIRVNFRSKRALKPGYRYAATLTGRSGFDCASFVTKKTRGPAGKGKVVRFWIHPYDDEDNPNGAEWCPGKAQIKVAIIRDSDDNGGEVIGVATIRFRADP
jgi:hypothetical protein